MLWMAKLGAASGPAQPASVNSRLVFVTKNSEPPLWDRAKTGRIVFAYDLHTLASSSTACDEQQVMVGLANGKLASYVLLRPPGQEKDALRDAAPLVELADRRRWSDDSRPLTAQQFVAFGGLDGKLGTSGALGAAERRNLQ